VKRAIAVLGVGGALLLPALSIGTHVRPIAATPVHGSLVPAYEQCVAPDRMHGPPLVHGSCASPQQVSDYVTVGTFDANGHAAKSVGSFHVLAKPGVPGPPTDNRIGFEVSITDVRCKGISSGCAGPGADYTGTMKARIPMQITDHHNGPDPVWGGNEPGTAQRFDFDFPFSCTATSDPDIGSTCARQVGYIEEFGIAIQDGLRTLWEYRPLQVWDGGADGDSSTAGDNTLFAVQGLFVP
jgi:hypothetical protein